MCFVQKNTFLLENTLFSCFTKFCAKKAKYMQNLHFSLKTRYFSTVCAKRGKTLKKQDFCKENLIFSNAVYLAGKAFKVKFYVVFYHFSAKIKENHVKYAFKNLTLKKGVI